MSETKTMPEIKLSDEDFKKFEENINNPPEPKEELVNAVKNKKTMPESVEYWIQKGTPDLIADSFFEAEGFCYGTREELPIIHVIEYSAYRQLQNDLKMALEIGVEMQREVNKKLSVENEQLKAECERLKESDAINTRALRDLYESKITALTAANNDFREALEFYADKDKWSDFISDGNIFDEQDGDFLEAFNAMNGDMDHGQTARNVLSEHKEIK